ncbi:MAG: hypothetical protein LQ352_007127 [Teloschistes flavicans]|nr:MAG: hypothetical protein LQ352_007127 [Teloschistes flavicans]
MNRPSRTDEPNNRSDWNQSPPALSAESTTRADLNGIANLRTHKGADPVSHGPPQMDGWVELSEYDLSRPAPPTASPHHIGESSQGSNDTKTSASYRTALSQRVPNRWRDFWFRQARCLAKTLIKFTKFIGPGFMVAVAYIDPGNYSTDVAAGASTRFSLLFIVLMSNVFAILLQSLAVRLGTVTGMNLAESCRAHLPRWLNIALYLLAEGAIIATDIAELSYIRDTDVADVFLGYLPSSKVVEGDGIYLSCGILGATVMPHSLYLGSGMVQSRLQHFDAKAGHVDTRTVAATSNSEKAPYRPSLAAIRSCLTHSTVEVALSLFTFALFVNSAILIVSGASLSSNAMAGSADLFGIHQLLSTTLAPAAGTIFALALLLSGTSAGIVCTIAGQMLSEGALNWTIAPWQRRLITRSISITPSIIIAGAVGRQGLSAALNGTQVALSVSLPFVSAPLIYFTCRKQYMVVGGMPLRGDAETHATVERVQMRNHWIVSVFAVLVWLVIAIMNIALLVLVGMGKV